MFKNKNKNKNKNKKPKMEKPATIIIKGQEYKIELINENDFYLGKTDYENHTIYITRNLPQASFFEVACHELLHAFFYECGLPTYKNDEILIEFISSIFLDLNKNVNKVFYEILDDYFLTKNYTKKTTKI